MRMGSFWVCGNDGGRPMQDDVDSVGIIIFVHKLTKKCEMVGKATPRHCLGIDLGRLIQNTSTGGCTPKLANSNFSGVRAVSGLIGGAAAFRMVGGLIGSGGMLKIKQT